VGRRRKSVGGIGEGGNYGLPLARALAPACCLEMKVKVRKISGGAALDLRV
jgi:hypothetical protein